MFSSLQQEMKCLFSFMLLRKCWGKKNLYYCLVNSCLHGLIIFAYASMAARCYFFSHHWCEQLQQSLGGIVVSYMWRHSACDVTRTKHLDPYLICSMQNTAPMIASFLAQIIASYLAISLGHFTMEDYLHTHYYMDSIVHIYDFVVELILYTLWVTASRRVQIDNVRNTITFHQGLCIHIVHRTVLLAVAIVI